MAEHSTIEWTDATWNPVTGCSVVSPGCTNCYAMKLAGTRLKHHPSRAGLTRDTKAGPVWTGEVRLNEQWLDQPLRWTRPRMIFVCAHGDLFHEDVPDEWIDRVFAVMALSPQHTFQVLTKRAKRMRAYFANMFEANGQFDRVMHIMMTDPLFDRTASMRETCEAYGIPCTQPTCAQDWYPLSNVWLGVSAERQQEAAARVPDLLATPAAIRFVSLEPLLGPIDLTRICLHPQLPGSVRAGIHLDALNGRYYESQMPYIGEWDISGPYPTGAPRIRLDWVIVGGESGPDARSMHPDWVRALRDQCAAAGVPFFFKQWGSWAPSTPEQASGNPRSGWKHMLAYPHIPKAAELYPSAGAAFVEHMGKKAAGRLLDGVEHNGMPSSPLEGEDRAAPSGAAGRMAALGEGSLS